MEQIYMVFGRRRIMKKELLEALREYSYAAMEIKYQDYSEEILSS